VTFGFALARGSDVVLYMKEAVLYSPLVFFATIMFTEPQTTPPTKFLQVTYGVLVGVLFSPFIHFGSFYLLPEEVLLMGNIYAYIVSPNEKFILVLKEKINTGKDIYDFVFTSPRKMNFRPGQYMEWTLGHKHDQRGNRRYFTLASAPTEDHVRLGVKFYDPPSSFKKKLLGMNPGEQIVAGQLAGDFTLPKDKNQKLVFLAGGIGITPFRSMIKHMLDTGDKRDVILFFSNRGHDEIVYKDVLDAAENRLGIRTVHTLTDDAPDNWTGERGRINGQMIEKYVPGYKQRTYYISGTHVMVSGMEDMLKKIGIPNRQIKTDFFPGFA
jgi:ferredoxin-NADP reductase